MYMNKNNSKFQFTVGKLDAGMGTFQNKIQIILFKTNNK